MKVSRTGRIVAAALGLLIAGRAAPVAAEPAGGPPAAPAAEPQAPTGDPVQWVRTLQLLQDRVAAGSRAAHESQPLLIARINADLLAVPPEIWGRRSNIRAAITFALSGGGPSVLRRLTAQDGLGEPEATLARGALAYVEGREAEARRLLQDVDTTDLPPTLAGAIGLTQASLAVPDQPIRAIALLDRVRVLLPGTLTEEGALRREIFTLGQIGDLKTFEALAIQYLRRFPHSIYAGNFRQRLAYQLTQFDIGHDAERFATLNRILDELGPESRRDLYLVVAQTAIQAGQTAAALRASEKALALCAPGSAEATRGQLYRAAAEIVSLATFESGSRTLRSLDRAKLTARDMPLLETALSTAEAIGRGLAGRPGLPEADAAAKPARAAPDPADGPASLIPKAQATIDRIDLMLSKATP
ncbi:chemotaxis protein MotC [Methylobacterium sp. UNC300MFChir4.1]|uniref:chemotaxis protein n=1 Tax=Methylobacterium sp. UNC300MFChir4.1 TaxID=1502747 RepID=UPI0008B4008B|nr:chemotaxis protein [Methylobacterium sp. UNC300MFChir4.1]SEO27955.1 chemotaxis protein MotC [Methylobacterium sp. UNC300MFChir4.1]